MLGGPGFLRLRVGVGRPERGDPRDVADFVLSPFEPHDDHEALVRRAADAVELVVRDGLEEAQRVFN
jgi:PTH1 family peptidyl-tRNA hydrolase